MSSGYASFVSKEFSKFNVTGEGFREEVVESAFTGSGFIACLSKGQSKFDKSGEGIKREVDDLEVAEVSVESASIVLQESRMLREFWLGCEAVCGSELSKDALELDDNKASGIAKEVFCLEVVGDVFVEFDVDKGFEEACKIFKLFNVDVVASKDVKAGSEGVMGDVEEDLDKLEEEDVGLNIVSLMNFYFIFKFFFKTFFLIL